MEPTLPIPGDRTATVSEDGWMLKNANTLDGYHVDANGVWDGDAATESESEEAAE